MTTSGPTITGISHVALTVSDLSRSVPWYERLFGVSKAAELRHEERGQTLVMFALPGMMFGLSHFGDMDADPFDERRVGLDHISFDVGSADELRRWIARLDDIGVDHSGIVEEGAASLLVVRDPDGIQLEFHAAATPVR